MKRPQTHVTVAHAKEVPHWDWNLFHLFIL